MYLGSIIDNNGESVELKFVVITTNDDTKYEGPVEEKKKKK